MCIYSCKNDKTLRHSCNLPNRIRNVEMSKLGNQIGKLILNDVHKNLKDIHTTQSFKFFDLKRQLKMKNK